MKIVVVSPHPDDETLGACEALLPYKKKKNLIYWINITSKLPEDGYSRERIETRDKEIEKVKELYEIDGFYNMGLRSSHLGNIQQQMLF